MSTYDYPENTVMAGGYSARLTVDDRNDFHEYVESLPEPSLWTEYNHAIGWSEAAVRMQDASQNSVADASDRVRRARWGMYHVSKEWVASLRARQEAAGEEEAE